MFWPACRPIFAEHGDRDRVQKTILQLDVPQGGGLGLRETS